MSDKELMDDEIDLLELLKVLWNGKWLVGIFVACCLVLGLLYLNAAKPTYKVSVLYQINLYPSFEQQFCASSSSSGCLISGSIKKVLNILNSIQTSSVEEDGWKLNSRKGTFEFETETPLSTENYFAYFDSISTEITQAIRHQAELELAMIKNEPSELLQNTELVAANVLNAKRTIYAIDNEVRAIEFSAPSILPTTHWGLPLCLSALLGIVIGVATVLFRHAFFQHNMQTMP